MKIDLKNRSNQKQISNVRSQIKDSGDLKKFDAFLAKHDSFDFANPGDQKAAGACCGGSHCCDNFTIVIGVK